MKNVRRTRTKKPVRGLVLLMALGMLALFSLLAVTYVVSASSSRSASDAIRTRSRSENIAFEGVTNKVFSMALRGTNDQRSPFYGKDILGDIFGRNAITAKFGHPRMLGNAPIPNEFNPYWCKGIAGRFIKVSLDLNSAPSLSPNENAYNSRLLTVQEGPLAGQTFRIIKYVGVVRSSLNTFNGTDPNYAQAGNAPAYPQLPWASQPNTYLDPFGADIDHSVLIDISEIQGETLTGQIFNAAGGLETITKPVSHWLQDDESIRSLFFYVNPAQPLLSYARYTGYKCVLNDAPFNSPGIGIEDSRTAIGNLVPDFGNIDNRRLIQGGRVSPALLTDYNYLADPSFMVSPVPGIGIPSSSGMHLLGQSNEGIDVPDYRDPWLAHQGAVFVGNAWQRRIIPSFHRPEVMYYIANLFGNPSSLTQAQRVELLRLLDASTSRIMSYQLTDNNGNVVLQSNPNFRSEDANYPRLATNSVADLQNFVLQHVNGPWDFDNDGDGVPDSVLMDSGLPATKGPDGKLVKPVLAILIEDLDGRLNVNLNGDRIQGKLSGANPFRALTTLPGYVRRNELVPQGYGFGPADISLNGVFNHVPGLIDNPLFGNNTTSFSIFDDRFGARRYRGRLRNFSETFGVAALQDASLDRMPGRRLAGLPADDWISRPFERDIVANVPSGRRSSYATTFDVNGNMVFVSPPIDDANPAAMLPAQAQLPSESDDDPYDASSLGTTNGDDPFSIAELESLLRRFDNDASALPTRLKERLLQDPRNRRVANDATSPYDINKLLLNSELLRQITTHSVELTHPKLGSAMVVTPTENGTQNPSIAGPPASFHEFIKQLHKQRYQNRQGAGPSNDPELNTAAMVSLFPIDFANGLKMDLNRPFGNGLDDDGDGQIDEPQEIRFWISNNPTYVDEPEAALEYVNNVPSSVPVKAIHGREVRFIRGSKTTRVQLSARQAFARSLYCLGQLIIPRSFRFPTMKNLTAAEVGSFKWYRLRANAIAQWAVNVVDYRDSDSAMTRFEYDIFPFGIGVMPTGATGNYPNTPAKLAYWAPDYVHLAGSGVERELVDVVWGMEMPELLLTESLAFHDKRVRDTDMDSSSKTVTDQNMPDDDFDQYRMPEGSLFLELYVPRTTTVPGGQTIPPAMRSLFVQDTDGIMKLDLGRTVASGGNLGQQPVWRIGISEHYAPNSNPQNPNAALQTNPDSLLSITHQFNALATGTTAPGPNAIPDMVIGSGLHYDISSKSATPPGVSANTLEFDRMIWFSSWNGQQVPNLTNSNTKSRIYYNRSASLPRVVGGGYAVVGPRTDTHVGSLTANPINGHSWVPTLLRSSLGQNSSEIPVRSPSHQRIRLNPNSVSTKFLDQNNLDPNTAESAWNGRIKPAVGIVCTAEIPDNGWQDAYPQGIGLNISMPHPVSGQHYWTPTNRPNNRLNESDLRNTRSDQLDGFGDSTFPVDSWVKINPAPISGLFPDRPFDYPEPNGGGQTMNPILNPASGTPMYRTGTYQNVRVAYLQRLADPEFGYDPVMNPYITVDWMSIDLTVFNGEAPIGTDPLDPTPSANSISFQSRYKDGDVVTTTGKNPSSFVAGQPNNNGGFWGFSYYSPSTAQMRSTVPQSDPTASGTYPSYFKHQLGYATQKNAGRPGSSATTLGYANVGYRFGQLSTLAELGTDTDAQYDGFGPPINNPTDSLLDGATRKLTAVNWLNRPFASPHEIMLVPFTSASQFGMFHSVAAHDNDQRHPFRYLPSFQTSNAWRIDRQRDPVSDPLGFDADQEGYWAQPRTQTSRKLNNARNANGEFAPTQEADMYLLLEFVETRSPYSDTRKQYSASAIVNTLDNPGPSATARDIEFHERMLDSHIRQNYMQANDPDFLLGPTLRPPQHMSSQYRAAGKPNLNTIPIETTGRSSVLKGIEYNFLTGTDRAGGSGDTDTMDPLTAMFAESRRGYPLGVASPFFTGYSGPQALPTHLNPNFPTQFAGAYRSPLIANLAPHVNDIGAQAKLRSKFGVETTLARSLVDPILANPALATLPKSAQPTDAMLFSPQTVNGVNGTMPSSNEAISDANRNPWTRLQREMRLPNLVSNQSNVYAMWITVTLYEYDPQTGFGNEYLDSQGVPVRERAFYIIDRSIPVGYKPGEDLNSDRTVLLKRKLDN